MELRPGMTASGQLPPSKATPTYTVNCEGGVTAGTNGSDGWELLGSLVMTAGRMEHCRRNLGGTPEVRPANCRLNFGGPFEGTPEVRIYPRAPGAAEGRGPRLWAWVLVPVLEDSARIVP